MMTLTVIAGVLLILLLLNVAGYYMDQGGFFGFWMAWQLIEAAGNVAGALVVACLNSDNG